LSEPSFWRLERFGDNLERWIDQEHPDPALRKVVIDWTFARYDNPYEAGLRRDGNQPNFYWGRIPGTLHKEHFVVTCGYWIYEETRTVVCYGYASLSLPL
jgi:hypothetical protein